MTGRIFVSPRSPNCKTTMAERRQVEALLFPIAMFLCAGGLSKREAETTFSFVYKKALVRASRLKMDHIGHPTPYADIMGLWTKDRRFVSADGQPMILGIKGKNSIATLLREACPTFRVSEVLKVFLKYGNVRRTKDGRYELVRPFFTSNSARGIALEPIAYFLADASKTLRRLLDRVGGRTEPHHFWRKVEAANLSTSSARRFMDFARERTFTYLEELDDWLNAHKVSGKGKVSKRRVGVGVFSIYSDLEVDNPAI